MKLKAGGSSISNSANRICHICSHQPERAGLNAIPGISRQIPQAAFYVFPHVRTFNLPVRQRADRFLSETGVAVIRGTNFGKFGDGFLRLCYADEIKLGIDRLRDFRIKEF